MKLRRRLHAFFTRDVRTRTFIRTRTRAHRAGFTLIEMLVVIGITSIIAAMAIGYSNVGQNENALTVETAKVSAMILQARELALATYAGGTACAYGVQFNYGAGPQGNGTFSLFSYEPGKGAEGHCPSLASTTAMGLGTHEAFVTQYQAQSWNMAMPQGVKLFGPGNTGTPVGCTDPSAILHAIMFYPPNPNVLVNYQTSQNTSLEPPNKASSFVCLVTADGKNSAVITVNPDGQVSF